MKIYRNINTNRVAISYYLFSIVRRGESQVYYLRKIFTKKLGDQLIYKKKTKYLDKYTLSILGVFYNLFFIISWPIKIIGFPFYLYFSGFMGFITDSYWREGRALFAWVNFIGFFGLLTYLIFFV